jgi:transposase-like protein
VIAHTVWLYFRFPLSLRMVEDLLSARGINVSHQTARLWAEKLGRHFASEIRRRSVGKVGDKWYLDEVVISSGGKKHWLWRAVDPDGFVLDALVQSRRNTKAAKRHGCKATKWTSAEAFIDRAEARVTITFLTERAFVSSKDHLALAATEDGSQVKAARLEQSRTADHDIRRLASAGSGLSSMFCSSPTAVAHG